MSGQSFGAVVLCAGLGSRMGELTRDTPKPLLPVGGRPLLDYTLRNLARAGVAEVGINLHYHGEAVRRFVGDGSRWGLKVELVDERDLSGTAGALRRFEALARRHATTLLHYGDVLTNADLRALLDFHAERGGIASLFVHRSATSNSVVELDAQGRVRSFLERPPPEARAAHGEAWTNSGIYALAPAVLDQIPNQPAADFPRDVFPALVRSGTLWARPLVGARIAIDTPERCRAAQEAVVKHAFP